MGVGSSITEARLLPAQAAGPKLWEIGAFSYSGVKSTSSFGLYASVVEDGRDDAGEFLVGDEAAGVGRSGCGVVLCDGHLFLLPCVGWVVLPLRLVCLAGAAGAGLWLPGEWSRQEGCAGGRCSARPAHHGEGMRGAAWRPSGARRPSGRNRPASGTGVGVLCGQAAGACSSAKQ